MTERRGRPGVGGDRSVERVERFRVLFERASAGLLLLDGDGVVLEANGAVAEAVGRPPEALIGSSWSDQLISPSERPIWERFLGRLKLGQRARMELSIVRDEGRASDLELQGVPLREGDALRFFIVVTNVTERCRSERRHALLARRVLVAQEEERARISRELHDELGQLLTALRYELGWLQKHLDSPSDEAQRTFARTVGLVEKAADELRHICKRLRPMVLDDLGLEPAVRQLLDDFGEWTGIELEEHIELDERAAPLPMEVTLCAYRVIQEALTNVSRHSAARRVSVWLVHKPSELRVQVYDDGRGFDGSDLQLIEGSGITGMRERSSLVGGRLEVWSEPFQGTRVELVIPLRGGGVREVT